MSESEADDECIFCVAEWPVTYCLVRPGEGCQPASDAATDMDTQPDIESVREAHSGSDLLEIEEEKEKVYKDARSTGRKRAAALYPISVGQVCEWAWHKQCGGGIEPIVGCTGRPAEHIHHGPDKSTMSNERDNISIICTFCHNRYHAANDKYYPEPRPSNGEPWLPIVPDGKTLHLLSDKVRATKEEILLEELKMPVRGKDKV